MVVTEAGIAIDVKLVQSLNADKIRVVTKLEIVAVVKLVQPLNVESLILVTEFGIVTDVKLVEPEKAAALINVTVHGYTINVVFALLNNTPSSDENAGWLGSTTMLEILGKPLNAKFGIVITELGIVIDVKFAHFQNAHT
jgi:hypothetical protein